MGNCVDSNVGNQIASVKLEITTWQKESHGLYDYESKQLMRQSYQVIFEDSYLVREGNQISQVNQPSPSQQILLSLVGERGILTLKVNRDQQEKQQMEQTAGELHQEEDYHPSNNQKKNILLSVSQKTMMKSEQQQAQQGVVQQIYQVGYEKGNKLWLVASSMQHLIQGGGVILEKGDIIKLGRIKLRVREINLDEEKQEITSLRSEHNSHDICRICLSDNVSCTNPLLNPCKCNGTMKYIHLECLQTWLRQKLHSKQNDNCTIYLWKDLTCELCKFKYKPVFNSDHVKYDLVELSKPKGVRFVLLELHSKKLQPHQIMDQGDTFTQKACGIYIITFQNKQEVKFGRAHENEVRVSDISVSRCHAQLSLINNQLQLKDLQSKFGTLILLKNDIQLSNEVDGMKVQVGRSVVKFDLGKSRLECFHK